ncbi:PREDICTED: CDT1-like protein a, chloroplastic isoform X2 [Camelina sativa]|uniref:CDT1-like protein a, chloroplastic isoform X2 n=1 Tax=Camelina sativa TaxID=90675 RepID=A0ABM0SPA8_CAMSA|nr:PREDICTED: CDT1-like protein a, chloroplastic isoform X2 [Camelina sativa]
MSAPGSSRSIPFKSRKRLFMNSPCSTKPQIGNPNLSPMLLPTPEKPPENSTLGKFFDALDSSIMLSKLRGSKPTFSNISKIIEHLTQSHLAQLKHILPEAIEIKRVLMHDERTCCMKPDLHVTLNADAVDYNDDNSESESKRTNLRKVFRARLAEFVKSHPQGDEVPEEPLPELFNRWKPNENSKVEVESVGSVMEEMAKPTSSALNIVHSTPAKIDSTPAVVASTPPEFVSTPARMFCTSLAAFPQKRSSDSINPNDVSTDQPVKLVRRSLLMNFDSYTVDTKATDVTADEHVDPVPEEDLSSDDEILLPDKLRPLIKEQEMKAIEDQNPAISQAKRRQKMIACLPKLFNVIHYLIQSTRRSVITKEELVHKIIACHSDITDRKEVEEQLILLQELVPEWMSEKKSASGDVLVCINKLASSQTILSRLEEENKKEMAPPLS